MDNEERAIFTDKHELYKLLMEYLEIDHDGMVQLNGSLYDSNISILFMIGEEEGKVTLATLKIDVDALLISLKSNIDKAKEILLVDEKDYATLLKLKEES